MRIINGEAGEVVAIEGLGTPDHLGPLHAAFLRHDGLQCGYCTPGQICSAIAMLDKVAKGWQSHVSDDLDHVMLDDMEIRERMSGNICRCSAYPTIVAALRDGCRAPGGGGGMRSFDYARARTVNEALAAGAGGGR